jgi:hypothetical protein
LALSEQSDGIAGVDLPRSYLLYHMVSGDPVFGRIPTPAVRWLTTPTDIAVWVTAADATRFEAELFHFGDQQRSLSAELKQLRPGRYGVELLCDGRSVENSRRSIDAKQSGTQIPFELPAQKTCVLRIVGDDAR